MKLLYCAGHQNVDPDHRALPGVLGLATHARDLSQVRSGHVFTGKMIRFGSNFFPISIKLFFFTSTDTRLCFEL